MFPIVSLGDIDKIIGEVILDTYSSDSCSSWLIKEARSRLVEWLCPFFNACLRTGEVPEIVEEIVIWTLLNNQSLDAKDSNNFPPDSNLPFLGRCLSVW